MKTIEKFKNFFRDRETRITFYVFLVVCLFPIALLFNDNLWFDETYTAALIKHPYGEIIALVKTDMHPPFYFLALKTFCGVFGYTAFASKLFSCIGYAATLVLGVTFVRGKFGNGFARTFIIAFAAVPPSLLFATQQRSYSWCIFFITLGFLCGYLFMKERSVRYLVVCFACGLVACYTHLYALLNFFLIFGFVNMYILIRERRDFYKVLIADALFVCGYIPWIIPLFKQVKDAGETFWLGSADTLSVVVFAVSCAIYGVFALKKENRNLGLLYAAVCAIGFQTIALFVTIAIRPFYIARYCIMNLGIFAFSFANGLGGFEVKIRKISVYALSALLVVSFAVILPFEYNGEMKKFVNDFKAEYGEEQTFVAADTSFGMMSYYFPDGKHYEMNYLPWYKVFSNVEELSEEDILNGKLSEISETEGEFSGKIWFTKEAAHKIPSVILKNFDAELKYSFRCDFIVIEVYLLDIKI